MTAHLHSERVEGCYRCDLSAADAMTDECERQIEALADALGEAVGVKHAQFRYHYAAALLDGPVAAMLAEAKRQGAAEYRASITGEVVHELITEWEGTCRTMGIRPISQDMAVFIAAGVGRA